jgi:hypothetical protein
MMNIIDFNSFINENVAVVDHCPITEAFDETNLNEPIRVKAWLKNNEEWYYPTKPFDLGLFDNVELLSKGGYYDDIFYAWNNDEKYNGRFNVV